MTDWLAGVLERFGQEAELEQAGQRRPVRAFLQPLTGKEEQERSLETPVGYLDERLWLYLGREPVAEGDTLCWKEERFAVRSARPYYVGTELSHWWATLERRKEAAQ